MTSDSIQDTSTRQPVPCTSGEGEISPEKKAARELFHQRLREAAICGGAIVEIPSELCEGGPEHGG